MPVTASASEETQRIQPIGLRGRRVASSAPSAENATTMRLNVSSPGPLTLPPSAAGSCVPSSRKP